MGRRKKLKDTRRNYTPPDVVPGLAWCVPCGKKALTKDNARKMIRTLVDRKAMREYQCPVYGETLGWWHAGHLPWTVRRGQKTSDEVYERRDFGDDTEQRAA